MTKSWKVEVKEQLVVVSQCLMIRDDTHMTSTLTGTGGRERGGGKAQMRCYPI